jgi:hypothetical protein
VEEGIYTREEEVSDKIDSGEGSGSKEGGFGADSGSEEDSGVIIRLNSDKALLLACSSID